MRKPLLLSGASSCSLSSPGSDPGIQNGNNADLFNLDPRIKSGDDRKKKNKVPGTTKEKKTKH